MDDDFLLEHRPKGIVFVATIYSLGGLFVFLKSLLEFFIIEFRTSSLLKFGGDSFVIWILLSFVLWGLAYFMMKGYKFARIVGITIHSLLIAVGTAFLTNNLYLGMLIILINTTGIWYLGINEEVRDFFGV